MTVHKAKGLEWDRVHLMSVNNYDYPVRQGRGTASPEPLVHPRPAQPGGGGAGVALRALPPDSTACGPAPAKATEQARLDYAAERLRLLYVGITRAQRELIITRQHRPPRPRGSGSPAVDRTTGDESEGVRG